MPNGFDYDDDRNLISRLNTDTRFRRAEQELQGMVRLIRWDGRVSNDELVALAEFLEQYREFSGVWPFDRIWQTLSEILADGVVTDAERAHLFDVLKALDSGVRGPTDGLFDDDADIVIADRSFVVTGVLQMGKRQELHDRLEAVGGIVHKAVKFTTDFMIAGDLGSGDWVTSRYGTKFQKVLEYRKTRGAPTKIVREVFAMEALTAAELKKVRGY